MDIKTTLNCRLVRTLAKTHAGKLGVNRDGKICKVGFRTDANKEAFYNDLAIGRKEGVRKLADALDCASDRIYEALFHYGIDDQRIHDLVRVIDALADEYEELA